MATISRTAVFLIAGWGAYPQAPATPRSFDVVSVKLDADRRVRPSISTSGPRFIAQAKNITTLLIYAFNLRGYQIAHSPAIEAFGDDRFDIAATASGEGRPTVEEFRQMLQSVLADRFRLRAHRERQEMAVYSLTVARDGPKFKESPSDAAPAQQYTASGRNYVVKLSKASMDDLLNAVDNSLPDRPVRDRTGLTGAYEIAFTYTPDIKPNRDGGPQPEDVSIFTAVEKLGLTLRPDKATIEMLIVDRLERPSAN
jgi:uncharacterized protein (TIGR03435 family)